MKLVVMSNAKPGMDEEYNAWYEQHHLPDLLSIPGVTGGERFRVKTFEGAPPPEFKFLAIYELDGDPAGVLKESGVRNADGRMSRSDALDSERFSLAAWEPA
jgi:hypothetical protein